MDIKKYFLLTIFLAGSFFLLPDEQLQSNQNLSSLQNSQQHKEDDKITQELKEACVDGLKTTVKIVIPTVVATSIVLIMLYPYYKSLNNSMKKGTESLDSLSSSLKDVSGHCVEQSEKTLELGEKAIRQFERFNGFVEKAVDSKLVSYILSK